MGKEALQASSTCEFLGSGRQPTPLWPGTCFQEGLPWKPWRSLETALCTIGKKHSPAPTHDELRSGHGALALRPKS